MTDRISKYRNVVWSGCIGLLVLFLLSGCKKQSEPNAQADAGSELRILYAGHPGSKREADFVQFLDRQFGAVKTADLAAFNESKCEGFDVTILDYDGDGFGAPRVSVSPGFSRPIITMGVAGAMMGGQWGLKTDYL